MTLTPTMTSQLLSASALYFNGVPGGKLRVLSVLVWSIFACAGPAFPQGTTGSQGTTLALAASPNPSAFGQAVTLTATVSPAGATGKVTFYDGVTVFGTSALSSGQATLTTVLLPSGSRSLKAYYSGDPTCAASTSAPVVQTVSTAPQDGFLPAVNYPAGRQPQEVAVGDFNADGKADLAVASGYTNGKVVSVLLGNGDGTFRAAVNYTAGNAANWVSVGDFNGDGRTDLVVTNLGNNSVSVLLGNGDGTFQAAVNYAAEVGADSVAVGDFNGDGKADLAVVNVYGQLSVLLGNGDGTFKATVYYAVGDSPGCVVAADFNRDGKADLAVANYGASDLSVLLGNGDGTFQAAVNYRAGSYSYSVAVGDFDSDGKPDLAVANQGSHNVSVMAGNGDGTFQAAVNYDYPVGSGVMSVTAGDFNGDGKADLAAVISSNNNNVSLLLGNGDGTFRASAANYSIGAGPFFAAVGDFNGDGRSDLAVANSLGDNVSILLGVAASAPSFPAAGLVNAANYQPQLTAGMIASLFGTTLAPFAMSATSMPLPTNLNGASVSVNGTAAPLFYVSPGQINFQIPSEVLGQSQFSVTVTANGVVSAPQTVNLMSASPAMFSMDGTGAGQAAALIANSDVIAARAGTVAGRTARPAQRGEYLSVFCTGLGAVTNTPPSGSPALSSPLSATSAVPTVTIGGVAANVMFSGLAPGLVGLYQVDVQVPDAVQPGNQVPVVVSLSGSSSNAVTIAVQ